MVLTAAAAAGTVLYVDDDASPGGTGANLETAQRFLQEALLAAAVPSLDVTEIRIARGLYRPDRDENFPDGSADDEASFVLLDGVSIYGGYAGPGAADPDARDATLYETVLSGDLDGDGVAGINDLLLLLADWG